jgi:hypothetical protein
MGTIGTARVTKRDLAEHLHRHHPEQLYPREVREFMQWPKDQLDSLHRELHATGFAQGSA